MTFQEILIQHVFPAVLCKTGNTFYMFSNYVEKRLKHFFFIGKFLMLDKHIDYNALPLETDGDDRHTFRCLCLAFIPQLSLDSQVTMLLLSPIVLPCACLFLIIYPTYLISSSTAFSTFILLLISPTTVSLKPDINIPLFLLTVCISIVK